LGVVEVTFATGPRILVIDWALGWAETTGLEASKSQGKHDEKE
jgi:hypothetical protein